MITVLLCTQGAMAAAAKPAEDPATVCRAEAKRAAERAVPTTGQCTAVILGLRNQPGGCTTGTRGERLLRQMLGDCYARASHAATARLASLWSEDPRRRTAAAQLQHAMKRAAAEVCATAPSSRRASCGQALAFYRARQADALTLGKLTLPQVEVARAGKRKPSAAMAAYTAALCGMPPGIWANGQTPPQCTSAAEADLRAQVKVDVLKAALPPPTAPAPP